METLSKYVQIKKRYYRSVHLERDIQLTEAIDGYYPTILGVEFLERFKKAYLDSKACRSFTITSVYGTGKSAFALFLSSLASPMDSSCSKTARSILQKYGYENYWFSSKEELETFPKNGFILAVATGDREPIGYTLLRAIYRGIFLFFKKNKKHKLVKELGERLKTLAGEKKIASCLVMDYIQKVILYCKSPLLIIVDELGKNLEYSAQTGQDLYLLQQIAEYSCDDNPQKVFFVGLLHQSFRSYASLLTEDTQREWEKIQGRFEDIFFTESEREEQNLQLISQVYTNHFSRSKKREIRLWAEAWKKNLQELRLLSHISTELLEKIYPLHPLSILVLPKLCYRYGQNERSLFTFLTSYEPASFRSFLQDTSLTTAGLPTLQLPQIYDYFVESMGIHFSPRFQNQRWIEIQNRIYESKDLDPVSRDLLKSIGLLNLLSVSSSLRATKRLILLSLVDSPKDPKEEISKKLDQLIQRGYVIWHKQLDEIRIWEGTDFNIEDALEKAKQGTEKNLAKILNRFAPPTFQIAQRHSFEKGIVRYFETYFADLSNVFQFKECIHQSSDGIICYWIENHLPQKPFPLKTCSNKPILWLIPKSVKEFRQAALEYIALHKVSQAPELERDGVARREVKSRIQISRKIFQATFLKTFAFSNIRSVQATNCNHWNKHKHLQSLLSEICDQVYCQTPVIWNELIQRRKLTSQGTKARRVLIEAMIDKEEKENLGIEGYGPERCIYESLLKETGIHRKRDGKYSFGPPYETSPISSLWKEMERFFEEATEKPKSLLKLYQRLLVPPFGLKEGPLPIFLAAILLSHREEIGLYQDGTYLPTIGSEHFELLLKKPERFQVKKFIANQYQNIILQILSLYFHANFAKSVRIRNLRLLQVVKPLVKGIKNLPKYTLQTKRISLKAQKLRRVLLETREPDVLLFEELPIILGYEKLLSVNSCNEQQIKCFASDLVATFKEILGAYHVLLKDIEETLAKAFTLTSSSRKARLEELEEKIEILQCQKLEPYLARFVLAVTRQYGPKDETSWLESIVMNIMDKPAESWRDEDFLLFQTKVHTLAIKIDHLISLYTLLDSAGHEENTNGTKKRAFFLISPSGQEVGKVLSVAPQAAAAAEKIVEKILQQKEVFEAPAIQEALLLRLAERIIEGKKNSLSLDKGR